MLEYKAICNNCDFEIVADNVTELPDECPNCCSFGHDKRECTCPHCESCIMCVDERNINGCDECRNDITE